MDSHNHSAGHFLLPCWEFLFLLQVCARSSMELISTLVKSLLAEYSYVPHSLFYFAVQIYLHFLI